MNHRERVKRSLAQVNPQVRPQVRIAGRAKHAPPRRVRSLLPVAPRKGTFHKLSPKHLDRYVQEFAGKHNLREHDTIGCGAANMAQPRRRAAVAARP